MPRRVWKSLEGHAVPSVMMTEVSFFGSHRSYKPQPYSLSLPVSISARNTQCYLFLSRPSWESTPFAFSYFVGNSVSLWLIRKTMWLGIPLCSVWICGHTGGGGCGLEQCVWRSSVFSSCKEIHIFPVTAEPPFLQDCLLGKTENPISLNVTSLKPHVNGT